MGRRVPSLHLWTRRDPEIEGRLGQRQARPGEAGRAGGGREGEKELDARQLEGRSGHRTRSGVPSGGRVQGGGVNGGRRLARWGDVVAATTEVFLASRCCPGSRKARMAPREGRSDPSVDSAWAEDPARAQPRREQVWAGRGVVRRSWGPPGLKGSGTNGTFLKQRAGGGVAAEGGETLAGNAWPSSRPRATAQEGGQGHCHQAPVRAAGSVPCRCDCSPGAGERLPGRGVPGGRGGSSLCPRGPAGHLRVLASPRWPAGPPISPWLRQDLHPLPPVPLPWRERTDPGVYRRERGCCDITGGRGTLCHCH